MEPPQPGLQSVPVPLCNQWPVVATISAVQPSSDSQTSRKRRRGARVRMGAGLPHLFLGLILIACGISLVLSKFEDRDCYERHSGYIFQKVDRKDRQVWPIWIGVIMMLNAVLGFLSKTNRVIISLYMACSIVCSVASAVGIVPISLALADSNSVFDIAANDGYRYDYILPAWYYDYGYYSSSYGSYRERLERQRDEYRKRLEGIREKDRICVERSASTLRVHIGLYSVVIACFALEFVLSIISASFTCVGLNCYNETQRMQRVIYYQAQSPPFQGQVVTMNPNWPPPPYPVLPAPNQPLQSMTAGVPASASP